MKHLLRNLVLPCLLGLTVTASAQGQYDVIEPMNDQESSEEIEKKELGFLHKPKRSTAEEQLAYAREQDEEEGNCRKVRRAYLDVVRGWHESPEAAAAQLRYSRLLEDAGKYEKAFKEYQYLIHYFAGRFEYDEVIDRQYRIANAVLDRKRMRFLFGGYKDREAALPLYQQILENAPGGKHAADVRYQIALIYLDTGDLDAAALTFETLLSTPGLDHDRKMDVTYQRAMALAALSVKHRRDEARLRNAIRALTSFTSAYPAADEKAKAEAALKSCRDRKAELLWDRASYYDIIRKNPKAALIAYETFIRECPWSDRIDRAISRTEELQAKVEAADEEY